MVGLTHGDAAFDGAGPYAGVSSAVSAIGDFYGDTDAWLKSKINGQSPGVLIVQGKADAAVDYHESVELDGLLGKAGVGHQLVLLEGVGHGFDLKSWEGKPLPVDLGAVVLGFLKQQFAVVGDPLMHLRKDHPRLLFSDEDLARALAAAKSDPLRAELNKHILATAEAIVHGPPIRKPNKTDSQEQERYAVYDIVTCAMAYRISGGEQFLARAKSDLLTVAGFADWNPQSFLAIGEMSFAEAIGYDWLYAELTPEERGVIKKALMEKSLIFADGTYGFPSEQKTMWSGRTEGNWNQVCNAGLLSAALAIADEEPVMARRVIEGMRKSLPNGMKSYAADGGFPEGPGYWTYGTTYAAVIIGELESALGTDLGFASSEGFDKTANYYETVQGPTGKMFNYADATEDLQNSPVRAWLASRFGESFALRDTRMLLSDFLQRTEVVPFDRGIQGTVANRFFALHEVWFPGEVTGKVAELPLDSHFRGVADIATFRSGWGDANALFVGLKAGENAYHHNHLDLGTFVLDADGERWAMDFGPEVDRGTYSQPGYGDYKGGRWKYFRVNNEGHGTVTPGEGLQKPGTVAPIVEFGSKPERGFAVADLTAAYPEEAVSLRRGIALLDRSRVLVEDEYQPTERKELLHWRMITPAKIEVGVDGRSAILTRNGKRMRVEVLEPAGVVFHVGSTRPPTARENQNEGTEMLLVDVTPKGDGGVTRLAVLLTPEGERWGTLKGPKVVGLAGW